VTWRSWLYCELGAAAGFGSETADVFTPIGVGKQWYNALPGGAAFTQAPASCDIPQITLVGGGSSRSAVKYYFGTGVGGLSAADRAKEYAGAKRWSATLAAAEAKTALEAEGANSLGAAKRDAATAVAYWTGKSKSDAWRA